MEIFNFVSTGPLLVIVAVVILALLAAFVGGRYQVAGANEALIVAGSRGSKVRTESGRVAAVDVDKGIRVVVGGGTFVMPLIHKVGRLDLNARQIHVRLEDAVTKQGLKVTVNGVATFKIGRDVESIRNAAERFLGVRREEIDDIVKNVLEGSLRSIVGTLTIEELIMDRQKLLQHVQDSAKSDLHTSGLEIDSFTIQSINDHARPDQPSYIEQLGLQNLAVVMRDAAIAQANAEQQSAVAQAEAEKIKIAARRDQALVQAEADVRTAAAQAEAEQAEPLARAKAAQDVTRRQSELAELEAERTEKELLAKVVRPAEAAAQAQIKQADGQRQATIAMAQADAERVRLAGEAQAGVVRVQGEAEAEALAKRAEAFKQFNDAAIIQTVLAELPNIVRAAAEPMAQIDSLTVLSSEGATDLVRNSTRTLAEASTSIKALTGLDIPSLISGAVARVGGQEGASSGQAGQGGSSSGSTTSKEAGQALGQPGPEAETEQRQVRSTSPARRGVIRKRTGKASGPAWTGTDE